MSFCLQIEKEQQDLIIFQLDFVDVGSTAEQQAAYNVGCLFVVPIALPAWF